jgi:TolB-like protein
MSGDPEQEYFADGMVEDIITVLSRFKSLFVIAKTNNFRTQKGTIPSTVPTKQWHLCGRSKSGQSQRGPEPPYGYLEVRRGC